MMRIALIITLSLLFAKSSLGQDRILLIQGAAGEKSYGESFSAAALRWSDLAAAAKIDFTHIKPGEQDASMKQRIQNWITSDETRNAGDIWILYLGHGTSNDSGAKLNLEGPDLSATELANWLSTFEGQLVFVHGGSASAPFLPQLSGPNRILITATRSGSEINYARFGEYFAAAISDSNSDLDLDGSVSLLEAFVAASNEVEIFYSEAGRLTSEHALLDDNGDGRGYEALAFDGLRPTSEDQDGRLARQTALRESSPGSFLNAEQIKKRNQLERQLETLYSRKKDTLEEEYFTELEAILDQLAALYREPLDS